MTTTEHDSQAVARHRTAISRPRLSSPLQAAARHGFLDGTRSVFDYGCGRGNDVAILETAGIRVTGWDPHFRPNSGLLKADLVNLGFVLNVIESDVERREVLKQAFRLTTQLLVVSVLTSRSHNASGVREYGDGLITERGTFQRYFLQEEAKDLIERTLDQEALAVGPGTFFVFADKIEEQRFLANRRRKKMDISHLLTLSPPSPSAKTWAEWVAFESHKDKLSQLWTRMLELGRLPTNDELPEDVSVHIENELGSVRRAAQLAHVGFESEPFNKARASRIDDLTVYFALNLFNRRQPYTELPQELQRDVTVFFSSYRAAQESGRDLLFSVGDSDVISRGCAETSKLGVGFLDGSHSLQIHSGLVEQLPPPLRTYVGCAEKLYGDIGRADLVKIHIRSGKVTFLEYESFEKSPLPQLLNRVKVNLRELTVDYFNHHSVAQPQLLYLKSRYMASTQTGYATQKRFDDKLERLGLFDFSGLGPSSTEFFKRLEETGLRIKGRTIVKV